MKSLYVTDLDGTLLNSEKQLSPYTINTLNKFIAKGGWFTVATARMAYSCDEKLAPINLNIPGIIMNGVCLYSFVEKKYLDVQIIRNDDLPQIEAIMDSHRCNTFFYAFDRGDISIYYKHEPVEPDVAYLSQRAKETCREIKKVDSLSETARDRHIFYVASVGKREKIESACNDLGKIPGIGTVMYLNIYNGLYCMEAFDENGSKANALIRLKNLLKVDHVIAFGDNLNDIGMMKAANACYATANAIDEVKELATRVIGHCDEDGVARFINQQPIK